MRPDLAGERAAPGLEVDAGGAPLRSPIRRPILVRGCGARRDRTRSKMWRIDPERGMFYSPLLTLAFGVPGPYNAPRQSPPPVFWQTGHG